MLLQKTNKDVLADKASKLFAVLTKARSDHEVMFGKTPKIEEQYVDVQTAIGIFNEAKACVATIAYIHVIETLTGASQIARAKNLQQVPCSGAPKTLIKIVNDIIEKVDEEKPARKRQRKP